MADQRFFNRSGPFSLNQLASIAKADVVGDGERMFSDVGALGDAGANHVSFLENKRYVSAFEASNAGACLVAPAYAERAPEGMALLVCDDPYRGYARIAQAFYPAASGNGEVSPAAHVDSSATLGAGVQVDAGAVIAAGAELGAGCHIHANAVIGAGVVLGDGCSIGPGASLQFAMVGARVIIHANANIGQDGFGFAPGNRTEPYHLKIPQLGRVLIGDDVEIGAGACVDRGAGPDTVIGAGTKIDNLVQIAHNVKIGSGTFMAAHAGVSGSTEIGDFCMIGGQTGFAGHLKVGSLVQVAAQSGVMRNVADGISVCGSPAVPIREFFKQVAAVSALTKKKKG